jgi:peptide/nickel transport system ATP-binding protein
MTSLLNIKDLKTYFHTEEGIVKAVDGLDLQIDVKETVGLVGESGCGKSVSSLSIMKLIPDPPGRISGKEILFKNQNLLEISEKQMRKIRGRDIAMIFQEPMTSLNPVFTIGDQISEVLILHKGLSRREAWEQSIEMLHAVSIPDPAKRIREFPHQMSGGMRQRVMIAMAISCHPELLIADEPTTALDVTIQAQILDLLQQLKENYSLSMLLITHDLGVVAETADRVAVMYAGKIIESAPVIELFKHPLHPYTQGLLRSVPRLDSDRKAERGRLETIDGTVPNLADLPVGCAFEPRCSHSQPICKETARMHLTTPSDGHDVRCVLYQS